MQRLYSIVVSILSLLLLACSNGTPPLTPLGTNARILAFGDSITYGTGVSAEQSYPAILQQLSGRTVINAGIPGEQTSEGLERLADTLDEVQPQLLILCLGGNDMLRKKDLQLAARNLEEMIRISRGQGVPVLLLGVPRPAIFGMESAEFYYDIAEKMGILLEAEVLPAVLSDRALKSDPIHPNAAGYRLLAETVYEKLKESGAL